MIKNYIDNPQGTVDQITESCKYLVKGWDNLSDEQKGQIVGYALEKSAEAYFAAKGATKIMSSKSVVTDFGKGSLDEYRPTQTEVNPSIVDEYYNKIKAGEKLKPIDVARGRDGNMYILEGHHRYLAAKKAGVDIEVNTLNISSPIGTTWENVKYENFTPND
ncbi:MAG: ParB/Srx family N-terminal domain-containing protein [Candidatus Komeilibacteria bacterium]|nr:ParB/Srx family N-terminal domain-containing protein [Candidatus Komeilibacteria bacterium]